MAIVVVKYNIGLGAFADGTWNKGGQVLPTIAGSPHKTSNKSHGGGGGGGGGGHGGGALRWKPFSHKDGKLVVLIATHGGTCTVNGVQGSYSGQTNGNRATYRWPLPGSAYGTNVKVVHSHAGSWTIPNGASNLHGVQQTPSAGSTNTGNNSSAENTDAQDKETAVTDTQEDDRQ